jgi:hypothetical protein
MATIGTGVTGYRKFINEFRAAFRNSQPFQADYGTTHFHFEVVPTVGGVDNLYLTHITTATGTRNLSAAEVGYAHSAIGMITSGKFTNALQRDYTAAWDKADFDIILLCTVEAARSKYIYSQVNLMLARPVSINGDNLKEIAQTYGQTQQAVSMTEFRPLGQVDYLSLHRQIAPQGTTKAKKLQELFI